MRTDAVHCRASASTGPVVLKVVPVMGAAFSGIVMYNFLCASVFPTLLVRVSNRYVRYMKNQRL